MAIRNWRHSIACVPRRGKLSVSMVAILGLCRHLTQSHQVKWRHTPSIATMLTESFPLRGTHAIECRQFRMAIGTDSKRSNECEGALPRILSRRGSLITATLPHIRYFAWNQYRWPSETAGILSHVFREEENSR